MPVGATPAAFLLRNIKFYTILLYGSLCNICLYLQGQKLVSEAMNDAVLGIDLGDNEPSESDTDSMSTPTSSPSHRSGTGNI